VAGTEPGCVCGSVAPKQVIPMWLGTGSTYFLNDEYCFYLQTAELDNW